MSHKLLILLSTSAVLATLWACTGDKYQPATKVTSQAPNVIQSKLPAAPPPFVPVKATGVTASEARVCEDSDVDFFANQEGTPVDVSQLPDGIWVYSSASLLLEKSEGGTLRHVVTRETPAQADKSSPVNSVVCGDTIAANTGELPITGLTKIEIHGGQDSMVFRQYAIYLNSGKFTAIALNPISRRRPRNLQEFMETLGSKGRFLKTAAGDYLLDINTDDHSGTKGHLIIQYDFVQN